MDWDVLRRLLAERLVLPSDPTYPTAKQIYWMEFDQIMPAAIAYCRSAEEVSACVRFARKNDLQVTARSGGHSFGGFSLSPGLVVDVSLMNSVTLRPPHVAVGSGALQIDVLNGLIGTGLALPSGFFPTVGMGGFVQGGGIGFATRLLGVASDVVVGVELVLADGRVVTCSDQQLRDLFWALRGGGGGNFGIVTRYMMRPTPLATIGNFTLAWPWDVAADVLAGWAAWSFPSPFELSSGPALGLFDAAPGTVPFVGIAGAWFGEPNRLPGLIDGLISAVGHPPVSNSSGNFSYTDGMLQWYGCADKTVSQCHRVGTTPDAALARYPWSLDRSRLFSVPLNSGGINALLTAFDANRVAGQTRFARALTLGGQDNALARTETAYVHRDTKMILSLNVGLQTPNPAPDVLAAAQSWADASFDAVDPYSNGEGYVNYIDRRLSDWRSDYYKENYPRLLEVKHQFDPDNFFRFAQSIS
jgi:FAD/FMN-containing dehydrogenase